MSIWHTDMMKQTCITRWVQVKTDQVIALILHRFCIHRIILILPTGKLCLANFSNQTSVDLINVSKKNRRKNTLIRISTVKHITSPIYQGLFINVIQIRNRLRDSFYNAVACDLAIG